MTTHICARLSKLTFTSGVMLFLWLGQASLTAQNAPKLDEIEIDTVLVGNPALIGELKGRVVVLAALYPDSCKVVDLGKNSGFTTGEKLRAERLGKEIADKTVKKEKEVARALSMYEAKYAGNPNLRCAGLLFRFSRKEDPVPIAAEHAKQVGFKHAILDHRSWFANQTSTEQCFVFVFDHTGSLCYRGDVGVKADRAIRDALNAVKP